MKLFIEQSNLMKCNCFITDIFNGTSKFISYNVSKVAKKLNLT